MKASIRLYFIKTSSYDDGFITAHTPYRKKGCIVERCRAKQLVFVIQNDAVRTAA
jgi:hypothetical protein